MIREGCPVPVCCPASCSGSHDRLLKPEDFWRARVLSPLVKGKILRCPEFDYKGRGVEEGRDGEVHQLAGWETNRGGLAFLNVC